MLTEQREQWIKNLKSGVMAFHGNTTAGLTIGREGIDCILPHRPPLALLDRIVMVDLTRQQIRTETDIRENDPVFAGHFPGHPIYPGIYQIEMMGQAGLCLIYFLQNQSAAVEPAQLRVKGLFTRVHHAGFVHPILPCDTVTARAQVIEYDDFLGLLAVQLCKGDQVCAHSILEAYLMEP